MAAVVAGHARDVPPQALGLKAACRPLRACPPSSPTRSPPARSSSGPPRSSRSSSRTRSTPAPAVSRSTSSSAERDRCASRTMAKAWSPTMRGWRSSGMRPARSAEPTIWRQSSRWGSAARRCRRSRRCPISCSARARAAGRAAPTSGSTAGSSHRRWKPRRPRGRPSR